MRDGCRFDGSGARISVERTDLKHLGDWRDAGDRFFRKFADAEGERAREFAIQIYRAAAHSGDDAGIFSFGSTEANQDDITLGTIRILEDAKHLNIHGFRLGALKNGIRDTMHAGMDLLDRDGFDRFGSLRLGGERQQKIEGEKRENCSFHYRFTHKFSLRTTDRFSTQYTSRFVRDLPGRRGLVKAVQNIPIAKLCVYTSTGFSEGFK
jgi:hypothetical protein